MATLRSEILQTAEKLSTGHTTSQPNHSKFSIWINHEDVNPMKNKGRVNTHISAGSKRWRFCYTGQRRSPHCATATDGTKEKSALLPGATAPTSVQLSANTEQLLFNITQHMCMGSAPQTGVCRNCCCCWLGGLAWTTLTRSIPAALTANCILLQRELELVLRHNLPSTRASGRAPATLEAPEHWVKVKWPLGTFITALHSSRVKTETRCN